MQNQAFLLPVLDEKYSKLYLGNFQSLECFQYLKDKNIRTVLVIGVHSTFKQAEFITYQRLDENINEMIHTFEKASNNIANSLKLSSVLVCCSSGLNYGPSIIIGYLIKFKHWQYEKAFYHLKSLKSHINPSLAMKKQLILFNTTIHYQQNQENDSQKVNTVSGFQEKINVLKQQQQYFEDSENSLDERLSTGSCNIEKTPGFNSPGFCSPKNKINNTRKQQSLNKEQKQIINALSTQSPKVGKSRHIRNITFQQDEIQEQIQNVKVEEQMNYENSPTFIIEQEQEDDKVNLRHRRRRIIHRTKSAFS